MSTTSIEDELVETVCGIPGTHCEIVMLLPPDGGAGLELARFITPDHVPGSPKAMPDEPGLRKVSFEADDLDACRRRGGCRRLRARGRHRPVREFGQYENSVRM